MQLFKCRQISCLKYFLNKHQISILILIIFGFLLTIIIFHFLLILIIFRFLLILIIFGSNHIFIFRLFSGCKQSLCSDGRKKWQRIFRCHSFTAGSIWRSHCHSSSQQFGNTRLRNNERDRIPSKFYFGIAKRYFFFSDKDIFDKNSIHN